MRENRLLLDLPLSADFDKVPVWHAVERKSSRPRNDAARSLRRFAVQCFARAFARMVALILATH